jgi:heme O synthase-like polyprenyltransferase
MNIVNMVEKSSTFLITIFVSFIAAFPAACRWFDFFQKPLVEKFLLVLVLITIFFPMIWWKIHRSVNNFQINQLKPVGITAAALASIVVMIIFHWQPRHFNPRSILRSSRRAM